MAHYMLENLSVKEDILNDPKYDYLFSVEVVNDLVLHGTPFREAYKKVGLDIENGTFKAPHTVHHTHEGSIGNLCTQQIAALMDAQLARFHFERVEAAEAALAPKTLERQLSGTVHGQPADRGKTAAQATNLQQKPIKPSVIPP